MEQNHVNRSLNRDLFKQMIVNQEHTDESVEKNLFKYMIMCICKNKKSWKIIDELYYKNYDKCVKNIELVKETLKNSTIEGECIETKCYLQKILILTGLDQLYDKQGILFDIAKYTFNRAYKYAVSVNKIKLERYQLKFLKNTQHPSELCPELIALLFFARVLNKEVCKDDKIYYILLNIFSDSNYNKSMDNIRKNYDYKKCSKERRALINKLEGILRANKFPKYNYDNMVHLSEETNHQVSKIYEKISFMSLASLAFNKFEIGAILDDAEVDKDTIKNIISMYVGMINLSEKKDKEIELEDINIDELTLFVCMYMILALFVDVYNRTDKFFFDNYNQNTINAQKKLIKENSELKEGNLNLLKDIEDLQKEVSELKRQLNKSSKELSQAKSNDKELFELRNYLFNNQEKRVDEIAITNEYSLSHLDNKKVVCFGGTSSWVSNISEDFDWSFIPADNINFDTNIIKDADTIIIKATCISHGMYYKIISNAPKEADIKFINGTNINKIKYELSAYSN